MDQALQGGGMRSTECPSRYLFAFVWQIWHVVLKDMSHSCKNSQMLMVRGLKIFFHGSTLKRQKKHFYIIDFISHYLLRDKWILLMGRTIVDVDSCPEWWLLLRYTGLEIPQWWERFSPPDSSTSWSFLTLTSCTLHYNDFINRIQILPWRQAVLHCCFAQDDFHN